jgi:hypothetical protein
MTPAVSRSLVAMIAESHSGESSDDLILKKGAARPLTHRPGSESPQTVRLSRLDRGADSC